MCWDGFIATNAKEERGRGNARRPNTGLYGLIPRPPCGGGRSCPVWVVNAFTSNKFASALVDVVSGALFGEAGAASFPPVAGGIGSGVTRHAEKVGLRRYFAALKHRSRERP